MEIEKRFSLLKSVVNIYIVRDDKSFRGAYCDFLDWLRRKSGISVQLFIFRPAKQEVYFYGNQKCAVELSKMFGGCFQQDWRDIYCWWVQDEKVSVADIEEALLFL